MSTELTSLLAVDPLIRLQRASALLYAGVEFAFYDYQMTPSEAFDPQGGLPLLVGRAHRAFRLCHSRGHLSDEFPFIIEQDPQMTAMTGFRTRVRQGRQRFAMGALFLCYAANESIRVAGRPSRGNLDAFIDDLNDFYGHLTAQPSAPTAGRS